MGKATSRAATPIWPCVVQGCTWNAPHEESNWATITCVQEGCGYETGTKGLCGEHRVIGFSSVNIEPHTTSCTVCNKTGKAPKTCTNCDTSFQETYNKGCSHSQFGEHYVNS